MILTPTQWNAARWFANVCFIVATISLLSPIVASTAVFPWAAYLLGNVVWATDSFVHKNWPWLWLASFFSIWDALLIGTRVFGLEIFTIFEPFVKLLENLP